MKKIFKLSLAAICVANTASAFNLVDFQFNDADGTQLGSAQNDGLDGGSWDNNGAQTQTPGFGATAGIGAQFRNCQRYYGFAHGHDRYQY